MLGKILPSEDSSVAALLYCSGDLRVTRRAIDKLTQKIINCEKWAKFFREALVSGGVNSGFSDLHGAPEYLAQNDRLRRLGSKNVCSRRKSTFAGKR